MSKRIFSGIQPSGVLHLGNYLGAIKNWVELQEKFDPIFCVVDLHAITVPQKPEELRKKTLEVAKIYLAAGIDPEKSTIFVQSRVPEHSELAWILNTITKNGELARMTQFKSKSGIQLSFEDLEKQLEDLLNLKVSEKFPKAKILDNKSAAEVIDHIKDSAVEPIYNKFKDTLDSFRKIGVGLFDYPILMAADILLYDTNLVPVGEDQLQHVEMARTLARRFNNTFGETFVIPEPHIVKEGMRIMGLDDPTKKMSKSAASAYNYISLTDDPDTVRDKIKKAVTDSAKSIKYADDQPALKNLINIFALLDNAKPQEIASAYRGKGYAEFKNDLADVIVGFLEPFQEKYNSIDDQEVLQILENGEEKAKNLAEEKMEAVRQKIGLL